MLMRIKIQGGFEFEVEVFTKCAHGEIKYVAELQDQVISFFDSRVEYSGKTIEDCVSAIAVALDDAVAKAQE